jgi:hypothetical protein
MATGLQVGNRRLAASTIAGTIAGVTIKRDRVARCVFGYGPTLLLVVIGLFVSVVRWDSDPASALVLGAAVILAAVLVVFSINRRVD